MASRSTSQTPSPGRGGQLHAQVGDARRQAADQGQVRGPVGHHGDVAGVDAERDVGAVRGLVEQVQGRPGEHLAEHVGAEEVADAGEAERAVPEGGEDAEDQVGEDQEADQDELVVGRELTEQVDDVHGDVSSGGV
jgi:hypothetical protein